MDILIRSVAIIALGVISSCSKDAPEHELAVPDLDAAHMPLEHDFVASTPAPALLRADTIPGVEVLARSEFRVGDDGTLDFGAVPAGEFMPTMRFMSGVYSALIFVENNSNGPLALTDFVIDDVVAQEESNPFTGCDVKFEPYELPAGMRLGVFICFNPETNTESSATARFIDTNGETVAMIEIRGNGRDLEEDEFAPMGLIAPNPVEDMGDSGRIEVRNGRLIEVQSGEDVTPGTKDNMWPAERKKEEVACVVEITGGGEIPNPGVSAQWPGNTATNTGNIGINQGVSGDEINVGQHVILDVLILCPDGTSPVPTTVLWTIGGDHLRDYDETIRSATVTEIPMTNPDLIVTPRDLYWKATGTHQVECKVDYTWNGQPITANVQRDFVVERDNLDIDRQMEDFYLWNHEAKALKAHYSWHPANPSTPCDSSAGEDFFLFHRQLLGSSNGFRLTFGYPRSGFWDGTVALPVSPDSLHRVRRPRGIPFSIPGWLTRLGNGDVSACNRETKLADFADADALADQVEGGWHVLGHSRISGEMGTFNSPKDPMFFRWHLAIDTVYHNWRIITGQP